MLRAAAESLLSLVYPHACRVCQDGVNALQSSICCAECWAEARFFHGDEMLCVKCGSLLGERRDPLSVRCRQCGDFAFDRAASLGVYEGALAAAVIELKKSPFLDPTLRNALSGSAILGEIASRADVIIPVPLSRLRRHERGFNQAETIATAISTITNIPADHATLIRTRHTKMHRMGMDSKARHAASFKAFEVGRPELIQGRRILLVDDVMTSGATAAACAAVLKKNGSGEVGVFTLARAVMH